MTLRIQLSPRAASAAQISGEARLGRRVFRIACGIVISVLYSQALSAAPPKRPDAHEVDPPPSLEFQVWTFEKSSLYGTKNFAVVALPKERAPGEKFPLAVILPGGEHTMQRRDHGTWGVWSDFRLGEGLETLAKGRLSVAAMHGCGGEEEVTLFSSRLEKTPLRRMVFVTPFVLRRQTRLEPHGDMNTPFIQELVERARKELPVETDRGLTALAGVSAGGAWVFHVGARLSELFGTLIAIQPYTDGYEAAFRKLLKERKNQAQSIVVVSSKADALWKHNTRFVGELRADGLVAEHRVLPGPHAPEFMMGPGGIELLLSLGENFARAPASAVPTSSANLPPPASNAATSASTPNIVPATSVTQAAPASLVAIDYPAVPPKERTTGFARWLAFGLVALGLGYGSQRLWKMRKDGA